LSQSESRVKIAQKTVKDAPIDKLYDGWIAMLAGAHGLVEINSRLRADGALQAAFGRSRCAEQSVVQHTLDACTPEHVTQLEEAMDAIYRQYSQGYQHDYRQQHQILDIVMSGMPCGPKAAFARHRIHGLATQSVRETTGAGAGQSLRRGGGRSFVR